MKQPEKLTIGAESTKLVFASVMLGMLELIEKGKISNADAAMAFCLPIMLRIKEDTMMYLICSMVEELDTYPPTHRAEEIEKIRALCYEMVADDSRADQPILFEIQHGDDIS